MASIFKLNKFWDQQELVNWCTGIVLHLLNGDVFLVVWDEAGHRFRLHHVVSYRAQERVVDHPERWPLLVKESGQELMPFEWEQLIMKGNLTIKYVLTEEQYRRRFALPNEVANEEPRDDRKRTAEVLNPEEDGGVDEKRARPTVEEVFSADDSDSESSCASDYCASTQPLDDGPEEEEAEEEEMERTGFPVPLDFEVELKCIPGTPEHIAKWVPMLNDLSVENKNKWHRLSFDEQFAVLLHLKAFEMPLEFLRFLRFRAFTRNENGELIRVWPSDRAYDGLKEEDRNAFIECMDETEDIFEHDSDHQPTFVDLRVVCDGRSRSFGSSYAVTGSDQRLVTLSRRDSL